MKTRTPRTVQGLAGIAVVVVLLAAAGPATAGSVPTATDAGPEAWLDRAVPADPKPGSTLSIGFMVWDPAARTLVRDVTPFVRLAPAGGGTAVQVPATVDWPAHYIAAVAVPDGGAGKLEIGLAGRACDATGCQEADAMYRVAGVGPPPGTPLPAVASARIQLPATAMVAGRPVALAVALTPSADWDATTFPFPATVVLQASVLRGPPLADTTAIAVAGAPGRYEAAVTFPDAADSVVTAGAAADGGAPLPFSTSSVRLTVDADGGGAEPTDTGTAAPHPEQPGSPVPALPAAIAVVALVLLLLLVIGYRRARAAGDGG